MQTIFVSNRSALVTGASAGIGLELARALAPKVDSLILVARRVEHMEQLRIDLQSRFPALKIAVEVADLSVSEAVQDPLRRLKTRGLNVDVLVNNAGLGESELFERSPWTRIEQIVDVNIVAMLWLTRHLLPPMIDRGRGAIPNIRVRSWIRGHGERGCVYGLEALRASVYGIAPSATCGHRNHRI